MISKHYYIFSNSWFPWLLRLVLSVSMLSLLFIQIDILRVLNILSLVNVRLLGPILVLSFVIRLILAYQIAIGLIPLHMRFTILHLLKINFISGFYSLVLPGNSVAGGAASWYKLSRPTGQGIEALALLIHFRLVSTLTLLGIGLVGAWFDPHLASFRFRAVIGAMFTGVILLSLPFFSPAVTCLIERRGRPLLHYFSLPSWIQIKGQTVWKALTAFQALKKRAVILIFVLSFLSHVLGSFSIYLIALAIDIHLSLFMICWIRPLLDIIQMIPISIGGLGVREFSLVLLLHGYGIPESQVLSLSLAIFSTIVIDGIVGGLLEVWDFFPGVNAKSTILFWRAR